MREMSMFEEPDEVEASRLRPGDIVFVPLIGKRLVAGHDGAAFFLDYPKRPRVLGSPAAEPGVSLTEPDDDRYLGWFRLEGRWTVVGTSELTGNPEPAIAHPDEAELRELLDRLLRATDELHAIANRTGGRPINASLEEALRNMRSIDLAARSLPSNNRTSEFQDLLQSVQRSADQLAIDVKAGVPTSAAREMIGAVQAYDDDF